MRLSSFVAAFLLPFAVAALPLLSIFVDFGFASQAEDALVIADVPAESVIDEATDAGAPMAYGSKDSASSLDCAGASIVAIEG